MIMFGSLANTDKPHVYLSILALISFIVYFLKFSVLLDKLFIPCYASKHTILFYYDNLLFYESLVLFTDYITNSFILHSVIGFS
jgi:hypothetical protein